MVMMLSVNLSFDLEFGFDLVRYPKSGSNPATERQRSEGGSLSLFGRKVTFFDVNFLQKVDPFDFVLFSVNGK